MSLILCPECGTKISDKALVCPNCGYYSKNPKKPISTQDKYEVVPYFSYDIEDWIPSRDELSTISYEDNKRLFLQFGKWKKICDFLPGIGQFIQEMAKRDHVMLAKMDDYVKKLIDNGTYRFMVDKNGEILPTIIDSSTGKTVKQVRLVKGELANNILTALDNLANHARMAEIIDEIQKIREALDDQRRSLQNDRIAKYEAAKDKLNQAKYIEDSRLREAKLLEVAGTATDAKRTLMRQFRNDYMSVIENSNKNKNIFEKLGSVVFNDNKDTSQNADNAINTLVMITNAVQVECEAFAILGEKEPCKRCLEDFRQFVMDNKLNERDTLLLLNESATQNKIDIVNEFSGIEKKILLFTSDYDIIDSDIYEQVGSDKEDYLI